jgi:uncharacterized membrane protein
MRLAPAARLGDTAPMTPPEAAELLFEAVIVPHRSLSRRGVAILAGSVFALSALLALRFWFIGAWPVAGFSVIEVGLFVFLLRLNVKHARQSELLLLSENGLRIVRTDWRGQRQERTLPSAWLRLRLEDRPGRVSRLVVAARPLEEEIAATLGEEQKRELAAALEAALNRMQRPAFDNPQLRG